jgi:hypothetical protein
VSEPDYIRAHQFSIYNRRQIGDSDSCGCFYCLAIFPPSEIRDWVDERAGFDTTPLCPRCGIDSVLGSAAGFPITPEFLEKMKKHWFDEDEFPEA